MTVDPLPRWYFPEFDPVGTDLSSAEAVAAFDRNQGTDPARDDELLARLGAAAEMVLVDMGCGTGSLLVEAARRGMAAHGVDVSENMLASTRTRADQAAVDVCLHHAGFLSYEHHGPPADIVTSRSALHQLPDFWKQVALLRVRQFIRPGGVLHVSDAVWCFAPEEWESAIPGWIERMGKPEGSGFTRGDFETHVREEFSTFDWVLEGMLAKAGFSIEATDKPLPWYAAYTCSATPRSDRPRSLQTPPQPLLAVEMTWSRRPGRAATPGNARGAPTAAKTFRTTGGAIPERLRAEYRTGREYGGAPFLRVHGSPAAAS